MTTFDEVQELYGIYMQADKDTFVEWEDSFDKLCDLIDTGEIVKIGNHND